MRSFTDSKWPPKKDLGTQDSRVVESKIEQVRRNVKLRVGYDLSWWIIIIVFCVESDSNSLNQNKRRLIKLDWIGLDWIGLE